MNKRSILRILAGISNIAGTLAVLDLSGIIDIIPKQVAGVMLAVSGLAIAVKEITITVGDYLDDGKRNNSFAPAIAILALSVMVLKPQTAYGQTAISDLEVKALEAGDEILTRAGNNNYRSPLGDDFVALQTEDARTDNPHAVTKAQLGLGSADNTSDADKPVSSAQAAAIAVAQDRATHTGEDAIGDVTGLQAALDAATTEAEVIAIIGQYVSENQGSLDALAELIEFVESGAVTNTVVKAIQDVTTVTATVLERNDVIFTLGSGQGESGNPNFSGWGMTVAPPAETWNSVRVSNAGRLSAPTSADEWSTIRVVMYDTTDLTTVHFKNDTPIASGTITVDPATALYDEWLFNDLRDANNDPIVLTAADFPSGSMGIAYVAINSVGGGAVSGRAKATSNTLWTTGNSYYLLQGHNSFSADVGNTKLAIGLELITNDYYIDTSREPFPTRDAAQAAVNALLRDDIDYNDTRISATVDEIRTPVNNVSGVGDATSVTSTFSGWANDLIAPTAPISYVTLYNMEQGVVDPQYQWDYVTVYLYDGTMATNPWPGTPVATATAALDATTLTYARLDFPQFLDANNDPIVLTAADFPSGVMGAAYRVYTSTDSFARAVGKAPSTNNWRTAPSSYTYWASTGGWVSTTDVTLSFEFSSPDLTYDLILPDPESWRILDIPYLYAIESREHNIYFNNLVSDDLLWDVTAGSGSTGKHQSRRFTIVPTNAQASSGWTTVLSARNPNDYNTEVDSHTVLTRTSETTTGTGVTRKVLGIGDSTMANGIMLTELVTLFGSDAMGITTIGTLGAGGAFHEAISGKTAAYYATDITNVFFNGGASLDVAGYMATNGFSMAADDWVIINLGINDMFSQTSDAGAAAKAALVVADYTTLINAFKAYEPGLRFSLGLVIPPAGDQSAFGDDYDSNQTRQRYRENSLTLSREIITTFGGREGEDIYITPITAGLDTLWSFDYVTENASSRSTEQVKRWTNGVHPNSDGYGQIADQIHAFLKFHQ